MPTTRKLKAERPAAKTKPPAKTPKTVGAAKRPETKQDLVLRMLRRKTGATIPAIMEATGWQEHSVCGLLSAVVHKKLGLTLLLEGEAGKRRYRIVDEPAKKGAKR